MLMFLMWDDVCMRYTGQTGVLWRGWCRAC